MTKRRTLINLTHFGWLVFLYDAFRGHQRLRWTKRLRKLIAAPYRTVLPKAISKHEGQEAQKQFYQYSHFPKHFYFLPTPHLTFSTFLCCVMLLLMCWVKLIWVLGSLCFKYIFVPQKLFSALYYRCTISIRHQQ